MISEREELLKGLRSMPVVLRTLVGGLPDDAVRRRPEPGEWAIVEVVAHLADTDERTLGRLRSMLAEESPELPAYDQAALAEEREQALRSLASSGVAVTAQDSATSATGR